MFLNLIELFGFWSEFFFIFVFLVLVSSVVVGGGFFLGRLGVGKDGGSCLIWFWDKVKEFMEVFIVFVLIVFLCIDFLLILRRLMISFCKLLKMFFWFVEGLLLVCIGILFVFLLLING